LATLSGYSITTASNVEADSGRLITLAEGGQIRGRNTYEQTVYNIRFVIHTDLAGKATLDAFYATYSDSWNEVTIDDMTYTWLFIDKPMATKTNGPIRIVEFNAMGYAA
jgi:hypothetical protein